MSNFNSYSQPNPWTLSVSSRSSKTEKNKAQKSQSKDDDLKYTNTFRTARQALMFNQMLAGKSGKNLSDSSYSISSTNNQSINSTNNTTTYSISNLPPYQPFQPNYNSTAKRLGLTGPFINPMRKLDGDPHNGFSSNSTRSCSQSNLSSNSSSNVCNPMKSITDDLGHISPDFLEICSDERAKNLDKKIIENILNEIIDKKSSLTWDQIGGLNNVKDELEEIVILPMKRPDLFVDLLSPCKGLLLFGPPGTGKTLIGRCIASQSNSTFFSISASSLTSKWVGEGEKMVRALFTIARIKQPSVIFIDEIDSLLTQRTEGEHESSRRIKTEFLVQFDGITTEMNENLLVIGATNLPHSLDEAARRRFTKRLYIPLPNLKARKDIINLLMKNQRHSLDDKKLFKLCRMTKGYSGADLAQLCKDAALNIIRRYGKSKIIEIKDKSDLPAISMEDFLNAVKRVKATVSEKDLIFYKEWNEKYGAIPYYEQDEDDELHDKRMEVGNDSLVILN